MKGILQLLDQNILSGVDYIFVDLLELKKKKKKNSVCRIHRNKILRQPCRIIVKNIKFIFAAIGVDFVYPPLFHVYLNILISFYVHLIIRVKRITRR